LRPLSNLARSALTPRRLTMFDTPASLDGKRDPKAKQTDELQRRGPAGDARPNFDDPDPRTRGGQPQENVEDRPNVSTVTPEDYPEADRTAARPDQKR